MAWNITSFMISIIMVGVFVGGIALFMNEGAINYQIPGYDNSSMNNYDKLEELNFQAEELKNESIAIKSESGLDVIGSYFKSAYSTLTITQKAYGTSIDLVQESAGSVKMGSYKALIVTGILGALTVIFFVGMLLSRVLKVDT